jgi:hypothetical protein
VDGSFEVKVPAGEYDLVLWVRKIERKIVVQSGVVAVENSDASWKSHEDLSGLLPSFGQLGL